MGAQNACGKVLQVAIKKLHVLQGGGVSQADALVLWMVEAVMPLIAPPSLGLRVQGVMSATSTIPHAESHMVVVQNTCP